MNTVEDSSFGIVPIFKKEEGTYMFCLVEHVDGHWAFPKGHSERGENQEQAARRELFEETSIDKIDLVPNKEFAENYSYIQDGILYEKTVKYFLGITKENQIGPVRGFENEIMSAQWFTYQDLLAKITFAESKKIAQDAYAFLAGEIKL